MIRRLRSVIPVRNEPEPVDYRAIGDRHRDQKQWSDAAEAYTQHLARHPDDAGIWVQCGNVLKEAGDFARSMSSYRKAEQISPTDFDVHLQLGHLYKITGQLSAALRSYEQAAALNPGLGDAKHEIQNVLSKLNTSAASGLGETKELFSSVEQLISFLKLQPSENDVFASYFRSIGGR